MNRKKDSKDKFTQNPQERAENSKILINYIFFAFCIFVIILNYDGFTGKVKNHLENFGSKICGEDIYKEKLIKLAEYQLTGENEEEAKSIIEELRPK